MTSHEYAAQLEETAKVLRSKPELDFGYVGKQQISFYGEKDKFLSAVRALRAGKKIMDDLYVNFEITGTILNLFINRDAVCRKVQDVKYECEPLLSPEEDAELESVIEEPSDIPF